MTSGKSKLDEFISMLDNVEAMPSHRTQGTQNLSTVKKDRSYLDQPSIDITTTSVEPSTREQYLKARERLVELEIEKDEKDKSLQLIQEIRERERNELIRRVEQSKEQSQKE